MVPVKSREKDTKLSKPLEDLLQPLFATMPSLEFQAQKYQGLDDERRICEVLVFDGEQLLGRVGYIQQYTRSGYKDVYRIQSNKIKKQRGDTNSKTTSNLKSALKIAKEVLVKDPENVRGPKIFAKIRAEYNTLLWHVGTAYKEKVNFLLPLSFDYALSVIDGSPQPMNPKLLQGVQNEEFQKARDNYRIAKSIDKEMSKGGAVVYVDREDRLSFYDASTEKFSKIESTYDLPKNYQEKYTMLKVMELSQPVQHVGIKMEVDIDGVKGVYYYLCSGDTVVTH